MRSEPKKFSCVSPIPQRSARQRVLRIGPPVAAKRTAGPDDQREEDDDQREPEDEDVENGQGHFPALRVHGAMASARSPNLLPNLINRIAMKLRVLKNQN